ncbi:MAG: VUT family protein [Lachnospiraceae bacterium]|nr:VUT family protein [Lachnospiraceae bacterium]
MKKHSLFREFLILQRSIPGIVTALFVVAIISMNLLANKSISLPVSWLALDCGFIFSWLVFLLMDIVTKRFGPKAATLLSVLALIANLFVALMLFIGAKIPGVWGESFVEGSELVINTALNNTFAGTWYVLMGSSVAFIVSALVNNYLNAAIGRKAKKDSFGTFALRSYVSTFIGQFTDNLLFALIVSLHFFGWSLLQCFTCAVTGAIAELFCEVLFSPLGYRIVRRWEKEGIGEEYLRYRGEIPDGSAAGSI